MQRVILLNQDPPEHTGDAAHHLPWLHAPGDRRARGDHDASAPTGSSRRRSARGSGDFVEEVAAELPLQAIADLLGVPQEDRKKLFHWSNQMLASEDPDFRGRPAGGRGRDPRLRDGDGGGPQGEPARRHRHQAASTPTRTAAGSTTTSSATS